MTEMAQLVTTTHDLLHTNADLSLDPHPLGPGAYNPSPRKEETRGALDLDG